MDFVLPAFRYCLRLVLPLVFGVLLPLCCANAHAQDRALGLDVSAWQGNMSQSTWNNLHNANDRSFVFIRSSRGGTTGYYNQSDPHNNNGQNTLSQRYDDPYFVQNITRATAAGMYAGSYHFSRPDIVESTQNSGGIANSGTDEADHFIAMAGAWMRPGYLLPVHDVEAGDQIRTNNEMAQFVLDFSNRVHEVMGIRPAIYTNGNYAHYVLGGASSSLRSQIATTHPVLWTARWPNQDNPDAIPIQTGNPNDSLSWLYGLWDDYGDPQPWKFWQYTSRGRLSSFNNGNSNLDLNVANGGMEFVKDQLVPAVWTNDSDGQWTTLANWNSGIAPVAPVQGPGQVARVGPLTLPTVRLPGADDTVVLERSNADITVTLSSGSHNVRKIYVGEELHLTGGSLTVNYIPSPDSTPHSAEFSAPVLVDPAASLSVHTLVVDAGVDFSLGGTLMFNQLQLDRQTRSAATLAITDDVTFGLFDDNGQTAHIASFASGTEANIDLGGQTRSLDIGDATPAVDLAISVPIENGSFVKSGPGTLQLTAASAYGGDITVDEGSLMLDGLSVADTANVALSGTGTLELDNLGVADLVNSFSIDGLIMPAGEWGPLGSAAQFTTPYLVGTGFLLVESLLLPGDFNNDGVVGMSDYALWRNNLGSAAGTLPNDDSGLPIGATQYEAWKQNFGTTAASAASTTSAASVPEPTSAIAIVMLAITMVFCRQFALAPTKPGRG